MDLGSAIAIFLTIAIVVMALFCIVTKYFNYKLKKALQNAGQVYSVIDQFNTQSDEDVQGQYDEFIKKRDHERSNKKNKKTRKQDDFSLQMTEIKSPFNKNQSNVYGVSMLRRKLDGQTIPLKPQTGRSISSMKSFRPQKLNSTNRSAISFRQNQGPNNQNSAKKIEQPLTIHNFISKLVGYTQEGISILDVNLIYIKKQTNSKKINQKKQKKTLIIKEGDSQFQDQLQVLGFQKGGFGCYKYTSVIQIPHMIENEQYPVKSLKMAQNKEQIQFAQYYLLKDQIQSIN